MVVKAYFQTGEDRILGFARNAARNVYKMSPPIQPHFFTDWIKFKSDLLDSNEKIIIVLPESDIESFMSPVTALPDYTHPPDPCTYVFGANTLDKWKPMIMKPANRAELEAYTNVEYVTIPTDKSLFGHIACALVMYDRKRKENP